MNAPTTGSRPAAGPPVHVVVVDATVRDSLRAALEGVGLPVHSFTGGAEFLAACTPQCRGCIVLETAMPGVDGAAVQAALTARRIDLPVMFLTAHGDIASAVRAIRASAVDVQPKPVEMPLRVEHVHAALGLDARRRRMQDGLAGTRVRFATLSKRAREVLALALDGAGNEDIARRLGISFRTVEAHRGSVARKLGATSPLAPATMALACGLHPAADTGEAPLGDEAARCPPWLPHRCHARS